VQVTAARKATKSRPSCSPVSSTPDDDRGGTFIRERTVNPLSPSTIRDDRDGSYRAVHLVVATLAGDQVASLTRFETSLLSDFRLPRSLPS
jgi:hypothetical protein